LNINKNKNKNYYLAYYIIFYQIRSSLKNPFMPSEVGILYSPKLPFSSKILLSYPNRFYFSSNYSLYIIPEPALYSSSKFSS